VLYLEWKIPIGSAISLPNRNIPTSVDHCERHTFYRTT
jgi:hypothetical protein